MAVSSSDGLTLSELLVTSEKKTSRKSTGRPRIPSVENIGNREEPKWTVFSGSQNLSAALNDPNGREPDLFTKSWGSYFIPTAPLPAMNIPKIELTDFLHYLRETTTGRKVHRAVVRQLKREQESEDSLEPLSPLTITPPISLLKQEGRAYDLGSVPRIFMQADFSLADPSTFQEVLPLSQLLPKKKKQSAKTPDKLQNDGSTGRHQSAKLLHEKLTHSLDIIEVHLAYHIAQRSDMFFSTLSSQQELQTHIMQVRHSVVELRHKLRQLDSTSTHNGLKLCQLCTRHKRQQEVLSKLKLISTVQQTQPTIQLLLSTSDFVGALALITTTQEVLEQELQGIKALRHLGSQLAEMEKAIEKMMEADFVQFALDDINQRLSVANIQEVTLDSEDRLVSVVYGLLRQGKLHFLTALREQLHRFLKSQVREVVGGYLRVPLLEEEGEEAPNLADSMRGLEFEPWLAMLKHLFDKMLTHLRALQGSVNVISSVCEKAAGKCLPPTKTTPVDDHPGDFPPASTPLINADSAATTPAVPSNVGLMESFQFDEAEDRLAQLMMDEELSDARLGDLNVGVDLSLLDGNNLSALNSNFEPKPLEGDSTMKGDVQKGVWQDGEGVVKNSKPSEMSLGRRSSKSVVMTTRQELTVDLSEKERLEDSLAIAHVDDQAPVISSSQCHQLLMDCQDIISSSCDLVHARCAKILSIRARAGLLEDLTSSDFVSLFRLTESFVSSSGQITGKLCASLRTALMSQAKKFLEHFHETKRSKLGLLLDGERWKQAEVPAEIQTLVQTLQEGIHPPTPGSSRSMNPDLSRQTSSGHTRKYLMVHGHNFAVVGIVLLLIKVLLEYCQCADDLPMLVTEVLSKTVDLLKHFNSHTCQLVLGAGAVTAVGLKTITARHLALVTRCLQAVILLIPDIKNHFKWRLADKQHVLLNQLDRVTEDLSCHCREINSKVMNIMEDLIQKQLTKWEAKNPTPSPVFRTLVKQILKLHENLVDIIPQQQFEALFNSIEQIFKSRLRQQLTKLGITNNGSTQHGIVNSELSHIKGALSSLENTTAFGSTLFDVWTTNR